jgi:dihydrofolate reductase
MQTASGDARSRVTVHMAASLDGFIARADGRVDWLETADQFEHGKSLDPATVDTFLATIDCYVMGSHTYETALRFESQGFGWAYGDKPVFVLTRRTLPAHRDTVVFHAGDLVAFINEQLRPLYRSIWVVGGGAVVTACLEYGLADDVRYSIVPVLIGEGRRFFDAISHDTALHLAEVNAYRNGMVELHYEVRRTSADSTPA